MSRNTMPLFPIPPSLAKRQMRCTSALATKSPSISPRVARVPERPALSSIAICPAKLVRRLSERRVALPIPLQFPACCKCTNNSLQCPDSQLCCEFPDRKKLPAVGRHHRKARTAKVHFCGYDVRQSSEC